MSAAMPNSVTAELATEHQALATSIPRQPSEPELQALANERARAKLPSLLPAPRTADLAAWNRSKVQWKKTHPNGPDYAPPEYIAYANVRVEPAASTPYRFEVTYNYDPASGALTSVENAQIGFIYWQSASGAAAMTPSGIFSAGPMATMWVLSWPMTRRLARRPGSPRD